MADKFRMIRLGMPPELAEEVSGQIDSGGGQALTVAVRAEGKADTALVDIPFAFGSPRPASSPPYWTSDGGVVRRFADRVFVGRAAIDINGTQAAATGESWANTFPYSFLSYYLTRPAHVAMSPIGSVASAAMSHTADNNRTGERVSGGFFSFALNDNQNASDKKSAWAFYGHAHQAIENHFTVGMELQASSFIEGTTVDPYLMQDVGSVVTAAIGVGGETPEAKVAAGQGADMREISALITLINQSQNAGRNRAKAGIVFHQFALSGTDGTGTGTAPAIVLARGHEIGWKYSAGANAWAGKIRADGGAASTHQRVVFGATSFEVRGVQSDFVTETTLLRVNAPAMGAGQTPNGLLVQPSAAGPVQIGAVGASTDIDLTLAPKAAGRVRFGALVASADVPVTGYIEIKDAGGTVRRLAVVG